MFRLQSYWVPHKTNERHLETWWLNCCFISKWTCITNKVEYKEIFFKKNLVFKATYKLSPWWSLQTPNFFSDFISSCSLFLQPWLLAVCLHGYFCHSWLNYSLKLGLQKSCLFFNYCFKATNFINSISVFFPCLLNFWSIFGILFVSFTTFYLVL